MIVLRILEEGRGGDADEGVRACCFRGWIGSESESWLLLRFEMTVFGQRRRRTERFHLSLASEKDDGQTFDNPRSSTWRGESTRSTRSTHVFLAVRST